MHFFEFPPLSAAVNVSKMNETFDEISGSGEFDDDTWNLSIAG